MENLVGQRFGRLRVKERSENDKHGNPRWLCKCDCENEKVAIGHNLKRGLTKSCGCLRKETIRQVHFIDLTGQKFNKLTVNKYLGTNNRNQRQWLCLCGCGKEAIVISSSLKSGSTKSCGCLRNEKLILRAKENRHLYKNSWTKEEDYILKQFYFDKGVRYCSQKLNRTIGSIASRAYGIGLHTNITSGNKLKKIIIHRISPNKVLSLCKIHGETVHYYNKNRISDCTICCRSRIKHPLTDKQKIETNKRAKKYRENPVINFSNRIRALIAIYLKRINNGSGPVKRGCFRHLDYTPVQLYNYLGNIKKLQDNKCPICQTSYDKCEMNIEHVIPLQRAKTEQEVINLFDLKNLNLMCKSCNSSKSDTDYNTWKDSLKWQ